MNLTLRTLSTSSDLTSFNFLSEHIASTHSGDCGGSSGSGSSGGDGERNHNLAGEISALSDG